MEINRKTPIDRLNYTGELGPVVERLCESCNVGKPTTFSVIGIGYDDCNVVIETSTGKYVAKMFSKERDQADVARYATIMEKALEAGVNHPPLIKTSDGGVVYSDSQANGIYMVLMKFIEGKNFLELGRIPDEEELRAVIEQAAKINGIDHHPSYLSDSWAIPNIKTIFERVKQFIQPEDLKLVEQAISLYAEIPVENLPHCFVHGDFTKANVMKGDDGKIYILDFSVSNWYPRIQELAVITANLLHKDDDSLPLRERTELVLAEYEKFSPLTLEEKKYLYACALAGIAMEFMGGHQEKFINGNTSEETEYWINLGRNGLRKELGNKNYEEK